MQEDKFIHVGMLGRHAKVVGPSEILTAYAGTNEICELLFLDFLSSSFHSISF
jgi:hypothetical protein